MSTNYKCDTMIVSTVKVSHLKGLFLTHIILVIFFGAHEF